jgi:hypothetical protein
MMRIIIKNLLFISILIFSSKAISSDKDFWNIAGELHESMLFSQNEAMEIISRAEKSYEMLNDNHLAGTFIFEAKLDFLMFYGDSKKVKKHIENNIYLIKPDHSQYYNYLYRLALIYIELDEINNYREITSKINNEMLLALVKLNYSPNKTNYDAVNKICENDCGYYPFYHQAKAKYLNLTGRYKELEYFIVKVVMSRTDLIENYTHTNGREFLAYLAISAKCQNYPHANDAYQSLYEDSVNNIEYLSGLHRRVNNILKLECKKS